MSHIDKEKGMMIVDKISYGNKLTIPILALHDPKISRCTI